MTVSGQKGFGLILMIIVIAVTVVLVSSITIFVVNASNYGIIRLNKLRAHYLAEGGVMTALQEFIASYNLDDSKASYTMAQWTEGSDSINFDFKANYAYFLSDAPNFISQWYPQTTPTIPSTPNPATPIPAPPNQFCTSATFTNGHSRLYGWTLQNIHSDTGSAANDNLVVAGATVRWTGSASLRVNQIRLSTTTASTGGTQQFSVSGASGSFLTFTGAAATRTLTPGQRFSGPCTLIQWNGAMQEPAQVTIQFRFSDGSNSHEVPLWKGPRSGAGRPHAHTLSVTSRAQTGGGGFSVRKRLRATVAAGVSGEPLNQVRILTWEDLGT